MRALLPTSASRRESASRIDFDIAAERDAEMRDLVEYLMSL
jgi:hypothetical protein